MCLRRCRVDLRTLKSLTSYVALRHNAIIALRPNLTAFRMDCADRATVRFSNRDSTTECHATGSTRERRTEPRLSPGPILSVFPALIVHSELKSVHPGFPVAFIF